jgi:hypothetical protein
MLAILMHTDELCISGMVHMMMLMMGCIQYDVYAYEHMMLMHMNLWCLCNDA